MRAPSNSCSSASLSLANLPKCHLHVGSWWDQWSVPVIHKWQESQHPRVPQISPVPSPTNHQSPGQWWTHVPRANLHGQAFRVPTHLALLAPFPSLLPMAGMGKGFGPNQSWLCHSTFLLVVLPFSPCVGGLLCSLQVIFRVSYICCCSFFCVCGGGGLCSAFPLHHPFFPFLIHSLINVANNVC